MFNFPKKKRERLFFLETNDILIYFKMSNISGVIVEPITCRKKANGSYKITITLDNGRNITLDEYPSMKVAKEEAERIIDEMRKASND